MAGIEPQSIAVLSPARAQELLEKLSEHNVALANQAERLDGELKVTRQQLTEQEEQHSREVAVLEERLGKDERAFHEQLTRLEERLKALEKSLTR
ncbi:MAG: hypothetical protein Q8P56_00535 [Candidatus Uhrbacteria bacterium]|nr:hypothetical protein [Candidatus Uhrbacteria bacterium]